MNENQLTDIPQDLVATIKLIYAPTNLKYSQLIKEIEIVFFNFIHYKLHDSFLLETRIPDKHNAGFLSCQQAFSWHPVRPSINLIG